MPTRITRIAKAAMRSHRARMGRALYKRGRNRYLKLYNSKLIYRYIQTGNRTTIAQIGGGEATYGLAWSLNDLPQAATFVALYDQYRLMRVELTFRPKYDSNALSQAATAISIPAIYTVIDYDDNGAPAGIGTLSEYSNCRVHQYEVFKVAFKPQHRETAYTSAGVATTGALVKNKWLDTSTGTVAHYGLKIAITAGAATQTQFQSWEMTTRLFLEFRNVH